MLRRFCCAQCSSHRHRFARRSHADFEELFGRTPTMADASSNVVRPPATAAAGNASSSTATTTENKAVAARRHVAELLERVDCEMYASHASASSETTQACLTAIHQLLLHPYHRGFTNVASLWESSLRVLEQASGATAINYFDTSAALLLCGKFTKAREVAWRCIQCNSNTTPAPMLTSFAYFCRVVSVYLIASEALQLLPHEELVAEIRTMTNARRTNKEKNETATADDEASTQLLLAAVEWLGSSNVEPTSALCLREGSEELWRGRQASLMDAAKAAHRRCSPISSHDRQRRPPSPFHLLRRGVQATKHAKALVDIYEEAVEMERSHPDFTLFELPRRMGERLLQHHHHAVFSSSLTRSNPSCTRASVIARLGSSLSPTLIAHHGQTRQGYRQAIHILGQMHGPEAYAAMKQVLMHRSPMECRRIQGIYGDVLRATHDGWEGALQNLHEEVAVASGTWRAQLPETLRLLSDAGKHEDFLRLIAEYNVMEGGPNLSVAASLAQVARQQGTWWRAMEVVDLIANAKRRPHTMTEDHLFLTDACVQTTYALRDAHKWKEALAFYSMLQPAFPPHAVRVLHAVVAGMPTSSPWEAALACISSSGGTPPAGSIISSLAFARGVADLPTSPRDQQHALQVASHAGAWEVLLPHALSEGLDQNEVVDRWTLVMQGWARGVDGDASASIFASLPSTLVQHAGFITRAYTAARIHGRLAELVSYINRSGGRGVAAEVAALAELVLHGVRAESVQREWTSAFVLREWCTFITASPMRVWLGPPSASAEEQRRLEERVAPPAGWLGHSRAGRPFLHLRDQPLPPKLMLHVEDDLVAFVVVAGGSFFGACCGAAAHCSQQHYALYRPIYHLPRGVGGIALLIPASMSTSTWSTSLRVRCVVVPAFTDAPPLLSCNFFSTYDMLLEKTIRDDDDVDEVDDEDGSLRVLVTCTEVGTHTLAQLLRDVEAEGWRVDISEGRSAVVEFVRAVRSQQDRHVLVEIPPARV